MARQKRRTVQARLQRYIALSSLAVLAFLLLALGIFGLWMRQMRRISEQTHALQVVFASLETASSSVENWVLLGYTGMEKTAETSVADLRKNAGELVEKADYHEFRALHGMVRTFQSQAVDAVSHRRDDLRKARASLEEMQYTAKLIRRQQDFMILAMDRYSLSQRSLLERQIHIVGLTSVLLFVGFYAASWLYGKRFVQVLLEPVQKVRQAARQIARRNLLIAPLEYSGDDELGDMTRDFNDMIELLRTQLEELWEKQSLEEKLYQEQIEHYRVAAELKDREFKLLQARINPHFLFNTLNLIMLTGVDEHADQVVEMLRALSLQLRYSLNSLDRIVTLREELDHVQNYFELNQMRFRSRMRMRIDADPELNDFALPALTLQPLVENSIVHGAKGISRAMLITLSVQYAGGGVEVAVCDDGRGMTRGKRESLMEQLKSNRQTEAIGLSNVMARLRLLYGDKIELSISSVPNSHTKICIRLPLSAENGREEPCRNL